jgi:glutamate racemase
MDNRPIGVFDSGLGGLTAVKELEKVLPGESLVYFGDTGRVPYGTKGREVIRRYARQDMDFLLRHGVKAVLAACGTVSSAAADIGAGLPVPYFDVVAPTARAAVRATENRRIGVLGTSATIHSGSYVKAIGELDGSIEVFPEACPLFVPLVENGCISPEDELVRIVVGRYLSPMRGAGVDTVILGCTHYPLLSRAIEQVMGAKVTLINSGREAAHALAAALEETGGLCAPGTKRRAEFYVTDAPENFSTVAELFLGHSVEGTRVDMTFD